VIWRCHLREGNRQRCSCCLHQSRQIRCGAWDHLLSLWIRCLRSWDVLGILSANSLASYRYTPRLIGARTFLCYAEGMRTYGIQSACRKIRKRPREHSILEETECSVQQEGEGTVPSVAPIGIVPKTSQDRKQLFSSRRDGSRAFAWAASSTGYKSNSFFKEQKSIRAISNSLKNRQLPLAYKEGIQ
jgi:hypothetical protein